MVDIKGNVAPREMVVLRDATGKPLISGSMETFKALDHGTHKATYEDRDLSTPLPNPIPANAAGVLSDAVGAPKPVYYADDENYYLVIRDSLGNIVMTVPNWNADNAFSTKPQIDEIVTTNFIPNAQFRSLVNGKTLYSSDDLNVTNNILIARDGWYLRRDVLTSTNIIEFKEFIVGQTDVPFNPKYHLNFSCSVTSTETEKDYTVDIGDVETFSNQEMTFAIWVKSSTLSSIEILTDQDFGTGGSAQVLTIVDSFQLTSGWTQFQTTFTTADVSGKTVGTDNKFRIRVRVPLNAICNIDISEPQLNIGDTTLEFDYQPSIMNDGNASKDAIPQPAKANGVDDSFKSLSIDADGITNIWMPAVPTSFIGWLPVLTVPDGWLEANGQTLSGIESETSTYRRLRNVINADYGAGDDGFWSFSPGASAFTTITCNKFDTNTTDIVDGTTGFTFATEQQGGDKGFNVALTAAGQITVTNKNNGVVTDGAAGTTGFTVTVTQQGTAVLPEITEIDVVAPGAGQYFLISSTTTDYYVWFTVDNVGADPAVGGRTGIKVATTSGGTGTTYAAIIRLALSGCEQSSIIYADASTLTPGDYFLIYNSATTFVPWYRIDGAGTEPVVSGTKFPIDVASGDLAVAVNTETQAELLTILFKVPAISGYFIRGWDHGAGIDPDAANRWEAPDIVSQGDAIGTIQEDGVKTNALLLESNAGVRINSANFPLVPVGGDDELTTSAPAGVNRAQLASDNNALDTRPKNVYLMPIIKY